MSKKLIRNFIIVLVLAEVLTFGIMTWIYYGGINEYCTYDLTIIKEYIMTGEDTYIETRHDYNNDGEVRANDYLMIKEIELGIY